MLIELSGSDNKNVGKSILAPQGIHYWKNFHEENLDSTHDR